ncbi:uncharacterized protein ACRADG_004554 [Cochliomyia hominivorax]
MKINMKNYEKYEYYTTKSYNYTKIALMGLLTLIFLIVTIFALIEIKNIYYDEPSIMNILTNSFKSSEASETEFISPKSDNNNKEFLKLFTISTDYNSERHSRAAENNQTNSSSTKSNSYYEEQNPVVVYSKTDSDIADRQMAEVPPRQDTDDEDPYKRLSNEYDYMASDDDYFGQADPSNQEQQQQPQDYYRQQQQSQSPPQPYYRQQTPQSYYRSQPPQPPYYRPQGPPFPFYKSRPQPPQYYDDSREDFPGPDNDKQTSEEARSNQYRDYPNYYRQYPFATPPPVPTNVMTSNKRLAGANNDENRKMQLSTAVAAQKLPQNRDPYPAYMDDYDYMTAPQAHQPPRPQYPYANRPVLAQSPQYRTPSTTAPAQQNQQPRQQMDILTIIKSLKSMWDLYQSFTSSWNTIAERRNREEELAKQKQKQLEQIRINSKKPPKFNNKRNSTTTNKNNKKQTTTTTMAPLAEKGDMDNSSEEEVLPVKKQPLAKVEPRRGTKGDRSNARDVEGLRDKRQATEDSTDVGEGRYIKGDPLKGYYDFVITEGSYKFWAAFQVGTAILIIYSTFAAIYYSKVNPLVSDYDYTDYLGGARSLSGGDLDFVDDDDTGSEQKAQPKSWLDWLPRTGHSLKFILDAIDKLPTDHAIEETRNSETQESKESTENWKEEEEEEEEYTDKVEDEDDETKQEVQTEIPEETDLSDETESSKESDESYEIKQAM